MHELEPDALKIAAERAGITEQQASAAMVAYNHICDQLHEEPTWVPQSHFSMSDLGLSVYSAADTEVTKQVETRRKSAHEWGKGEVYFVYAGEAYDTFGEARQAEMRSPSRVGQVVPLPATDER